MDWQRSMEWFVGMRPNMHRHISVMFKNKILIPEFAVLTNKTIWTVLTFKEMESSELREFKTGSSFINCFAPSTLYNPPLAVFKLLHKGGIVCRQL